MLKLRHYILFFVTLFAGSLSAVTLDEARDMYLAGDFEGALPAFREALASKPKDGALNQWVGVCLLRTGHVDEAVPYLKTAQARGIAEAPRYLAEIAFYDYDYDAADSYIEAYQKALKKARKTMPAEAEDMVRRMSLARTMLDRVEQIVIIDSIAVDRDDFFRHYRLSAETGSLNTVDVLPDGMPVAEPTEVYMPETRSYMVWAAPDTTENYVLVASNRLFDGSWEKPAALGDDLVQDGDSNYPFMMSDGVTLYYANNGENSIGGYDIFISRKNEDGFLQPQNIGMPYNSPYDDYMLAIDELTGVGWWATDRNRLEDKVTIYKFIPSDLRVNYDPDSEDLTQKARVADYRSTWEEGKDYTALLDAVNAIDPDRKQHKDDFRFAMPGQRIYTVWSDFKSSNARKLMEEYVAASKALQSKIDRLASLRADYASGNRNVRDEILKLERGVDADRVSLKRLANDVIRAER